MAKGNPNAIRAGRAYVELFADDSKLIRGLRGAEQRLKSFGSAVAAIGASVTAIGAAITAPLVAAATKFASLGDIIEKSAARTGASAEAISELAYAAGQTGSDLEILEKAFIGMQRAMLDAQQGLSTAVRTFETLGLRVDALVGLAPEDQFTAIAEALSRVQNPGTRAALALEAFGKSGQKLIPLLSGGANGIAELREEARKLGIVIDTEAAAQAAAFGDAMDRVKQVIQAVTFRVGQALAPALTKLSNVIAFNAAAAVDWVKANGALIRQIAVIGAGLAAAGAVITAAGIGVIGLGAALGGLATILGTVGTVIGALITPTSGVIVAFGLLTAAILKFSGVGAAAISIFGEAFDQFRRDAGTAITAIGEALAAGDIAAAARVLWATLRLEWTRGVDILRTAWVGFKAEYLRVSVEMFYGAASVASNAVATIQRGWTELRAWFAGFWNNTRGDAVETWNLIANLALKTAARVKGAFDKSFDVKGRFRQIDDEFVKSQQAEQRRRREAERGIERDRTGRQNRIDGEQAAEQARIAQALEMALADIAGDASQGAREAAAALEKARTEWEAAIANARRERTDGERPDFAKRIADLFAGVDNVVAAQARTESRGTFNAAAIQSLQNNRTWDRLALAGEQTAKNTKALADAARNGLAFG